MQRQSHNQIRWLEFDGLSKMAGIRHGILLRQGGVSQGPYASLNLATGVGDQEKAVRDNTARVQQALKLPGLYWLNQVHATHIVEIHDVDIPHHAPTGDAMICSVPGIALLLKHADCQIALMYDPVKRVIAAAHAGWRGNVQNMFGKVVHRLQELGSNPADLRVGISPSLGPRHAQFVHHRIEFPEHLWKFQVEPNYFDLWAMAHAQLVASGVLPGHIEIARMCTYANEADFFSYRRNCTTGRNATFIILN